MKTRILLSVLLTFIVASLAFTQASTSTNARLQSVVTEYARDKYNNHTGTASTDTLYDNNRTSAAGTKVSAGDVKYLVGILLNTQIKSDTILIKQTTAGGSRAIAIIYIDTAAGTSNYKYGPNWYPLGLRIDSSFVTVQRKKTSDVTSMFRTSY